MRLRKNKKYLGRKAIRYRGTKCLNCEYPLDKSDRYCPYCSQINSTKSISVLDYFSEFLGSILVYDSRLRFTLRDIFRPGKMTANYVKGQRLKYANPFRFFLSVSIIYFLLNGIVTQFSKTEEIPWISNPEEGRITTIDANKPSFIPENKGDTIRAKELNIDVYFSEKQLDSLSFWDSQLKRSSVYFNYIHHFPNHSAPHALNTLKHQNSKRNNWMFSRMNALKKIANNPEDFGKYIQNNFPFFLFFFTPVFAVFFLVFYYKSSYKYMDHLIFLFHIFSFYFLISIFLLIPGVFWDMSSINFILFLFGVPIYFYLALKNFYGQKRWLTLFKTISLGILFFFSFIIAILVFVFGSVLSY